MEIRVKLTLDRETNQGRIHIHILCAHHSSEEKAASRKIFSRSSLSLDFRSRPPVKKSKSICAVLLHLPFLFRVVLQPSPLSVERIVERHDRCVSGFLLIWLTQQGKKRVSRKSISSSSRSGGYCCPLDRTVHAFLVAKKTM